MNTAHFNIFNTGEDSFFTPGRQLANIAKVKPDAPAVVYISPENKETVIDVACPRSPFQPYRMVPYGAGNQAW